MINASGIPITSNITTMLGRGNVLIKVDQVSRLFMVLHWMAFRSLVLAERMGAT